MPKAKGLQELQELRSSGDLQALLAVAHKQLDKGNYDVADDYLARAQQFWQDPAAGEAGEALPDAERHRLRQAYLEALVEIVSLAESRQDYARALAHARVLQQHDPRYESTVRRLIHLHVLSKSRAHALTTLERRLALAREGQGSLLFISGEAGIGKTSLALAAEGLAQANGSAFALARAYERGIPPFQLWQDVLAGLHTTRELDLASLPEPFGSAPPVQSPQHLARAIAGWLRTAATTKPLVLLLDDLHWADRDSLDLLELVSRRLEQAGILIIITYRGDVLLPDHPLAQLLPTLLRNRPAETLELTPLDLEGTRLLIDAWLGPCSAALARYMHRRAEGHPLFLVELLADLTGKKLLAQDDSGLWLPPAQDMPAPMILQQLIAQRVSQLGRQAETLLTAASVVGEIWGLPVVEALLDWPESTVLDVLDKALAARIIAEEDAHSEQYRFSHGLIREVLYYQQLARRRKRLHAQIATVLEQQGPADSAALADHFFAAEQWDRAYVHSLEAGRLARQRFAIHSAIRFFRQALHCLDMPGMDRSPAQLMVIYEQLGDLHALLNQRLQAVEAFKQVVEAARAAADRKAEGHALFSLALNQERAYQRDEAAATREAAMQVAQEIEDPRLLALTSYAFAFRYGITGQHVLARRFHDQAEGYARLVQDAQVLTDGLRMRGVSDIWAGDYPAAERALSEAQEWARRGQHSYSRISLYAWLGLVHIEQGHYEGARALLEEGLPLAAELDENSLLQMRLLNMLAYLYGEVGDIEQARQHSRRALQAGQLQAAADNFEATAYALLELATQHVREGQIAAAAPYVREFEALSDRSTDYVRFRYMNRYCLLQTELALAQGHFEEALEQSMQARQEAEATGLRKNLAKGRLFEGQALLGLGQADQAVEALRQAVALADEIGHGSLRWQARLRLAQAQDALAGQSSAETYQEALSLVEAIARQLGDPYLHSCFLSSPLVVELKASAAGTAPSSPPPSPQPSPAGHNPAGLTSREVEVLRLVAQGMTNRQIGEALHISVRTVNTHITNILNKIACDNRTAAATFAMQHGLV